MSPQYFYEQLMLNKWKSTCALSGRAQKLIQENNLTPYRHKFADIVADKTAHLWFIDGNKIVRIRQLRENVSMNEIYYYGLGFKVVLLLALDGSITTISVEDARAKKMAAEIYRQWIDCNMDIFTRGISRKRKRNVDAILTSLCSYKIHTDEWVSPSAMKNYITGTPLNDVLAQRYPTSKQYKQETDLMTLSLFKRGNEFESQVIEEIKEIIENIQIDAYVADTDEEYVPQTPYNSPSDNAPLGPSKPVVQVCENYTDSMQFAKFMATIRYMQLGHPIIYQGLLYNCVDKTYGMPDMLVLGSYINLLFCTDIIERQYYNYYFVVDIKSSNIKVSKTTGNVLSTSRLIDFYKVQLFTYNLALGMIQGYFPQMGFLLHAPSIETQCTALEKIASSWCCVNFHKKNSEEEAVDGEEETNCDINLEGIHKKYLDAIAWVRNYRKEGHQWDLEMPHIVELVPNTKSPYDSHAMKRIKLDLVEKQSENGIGNITTLWNCTDRQQNQGWINNIRNWRQDDRDVATLLGFRVNTKRYTTLTTIIKMNQDPNLYNLFNNDNIIDDVYFGKSITPHIAQIENENCIYVDLEFLTGTNLVYMIGIGWVDNNNQYQCATYIADALTKEAETAILNRFYKEVIKPYSPRLITWGHAERAILRKKFPTKPYFDMPETYFDLCQLFTQTPIIVRGSLSFGLKSIAAALLAYDYIQTPWPAIKYGTINEPEMTPDILSYLLNEHYNKHIAGAMKPIINYNEVDVRILWEIHNWLQISANN